jgi:hypothetical protein
MDVHRLREHQRIKEPPLAEFGAVVLRQSGRQIAWAKKKTRPAQANRISLFKPG